MVWTIKIISQPLFFFFKRAWGDGALEHDPAGSLSRASTGFQATEKKRRSSITQSATILLRKPSLITILTHIIPCSKTFLKSRAIRVRLFLNVKMTLCINPVAFCPKLSLFFFSQRLESLMSYMLKNIFPPSAIAICFIFILKIISLDAQKF